MPDDGVRGRVEEDHFESGNGAGESDGQRD